MSKFTVFDWFLVAIASAGLLLNAFVVPLLKKDLNESHPHNANYEVRHGSS